MLLQELQVCAEGFLLLIPAVMALAIGLTFRWDKKWQVWTAIGALIAACAGCVLLCNTLQSGIAGALERIGGWWFLRTGSYAPGFEGAGDIKLVLCLGFVISGIVTAFILRMKNPLVQVLLAVTVLIGWAAGLLTGGWWLALYLLGTLLTAASFASGQGKALTLSGAIALMLATVIGAGFLLSGFTPGKTALGSDLQKLLHQLRWEERRTPLPEGALKDLGAYRPMDEPMLEVTMNQWTPLYLRGFTAGRYTDSGWEPLETQDMTQDAPMLYALQSGYFLPTTQIYTASQTTGTPTENTVTVRNIGACSAYAYVPYGAGHVVGNILTPEDLLWEGTYAPKERQYSAQLYSIESSYLLQADLKNLTDTPYRMAEGTYRQWVYDHYLILPQEVQDILAAYFTVDGKITTVQAKREIMQFLGEWITYEENVLTSTGQRDFLSYVLDVSKSGYSVHYATLATLMLRYCGIPARYVEGFVVAPSQAEALGSGETLTLTGANAHAWTEYYLDGVGWLPFDATPGYCDILTFTLPADGLPTQETGGSIRQQEQEQPDPPEKKPQTEEEQPEDSQRIFVWEAVQVLLILLLAAIAFFVLRTLLLRSKLRKKQKVFTQADKRKACAGILCYMLELTKAITGESAAYSPSELAEEIAGALDGQADAAELIQLFHEVWYSDHPILPEHVARSQKWLRIAKAKWKQKVPALKRFKERFITCKIL